jgi:hypothetical protein
LEFPGALYHVLNRGNFRQDLFSVHQTAGAFERTLFEAGERFGWRVHAYVVMSNHFHLALETPRGWRRGRTNNLHVRLPSFSPHQSTAAHRPASKAVMRSAMLVGVSGARPLTAASSLASSLRLR